MQTLNAQTVPLTGSNLIEASAGTGKTWTISWLYLRLVASHGLAVSQILVVTYTEAATAELRDRIRKRLADALAFLEGRAHEEDYAALLQETALADAIQRLQLALVSFDEAAIFTIHGFCKRVLAENAFEARLPFESELVANEDDLLTELSDQFWYQHFLSPDALHLSLLKQEGLTPDKLLASVRHFIGKPYLQESIPLMTAEVFQASQLAFLAQLQTCASVWDSEQASIMTLLQQAISNKVLNGQVYKADKLAGWFEMLENLFSTQVIPKDSLGILEKFTHRLLAAKTNKGKPTPDHAFFRAMDDLLQVYAPVAELLPQALESLRLQLLHHLRRELPRRKQQLGILTFDDLLLHLRHALAEHDGLALRLAEQYRAALIDEFQDTDPIQYEIFGRIYQAGPEQRVFYVGDPKQAIYGFRGADIYTYLQAAHAVQHRYTLGHNFRSHDDVLQGLNQLFGQSADPFRSAIQYEAVRAGREQDALLVEGMTPIRLWDWDVLGEGCNATQVQDAVAEATANDIARLLTAAQAGEACIGSRLIRSNDIAVLVRTNQQGQRIKQALLERGIASVQKSTDNVFASREASELRAVLRAIAEPGNETALKQALVTELFACDAAHLSALDEQPDMLETELETFHAWHKLWHSQGFMPMFRQMLLQRDLYAHLLVLADGERRLTNLLHLAELVHTEGRLQGHGMHALIRWLQQKAEAALKDETHQLRLESDENLVQIVTIHKSKGLEYGIVYCPYLWLERDLKSPPAWFSWFDPASGASCLQAQTLALDEEKRVAAAAEKAEALRLLYVAVTRAKYHCTVVLVSGRINTFDYYSALGWLLFGDLPNAQELLGKLRKDGMQPEQRQQLMHQRLQAIVENSAGRIRHTPLPDTMVCTRYQPSVECLDMQFRRFDHRLPSVPRVGSFSGLVAGRHDEQPDYDTLVWQTPVAHELARTAFPRGALAGSCLHKMLEELDFRQAVGEQRDSVLLPALQRHGLAERWLGAAEHLLDNVLHTPLLAASNLTLAMLGKEQRLDELEFYFPVAKLRLKALQAVLHQHLPVTWEDIHAAIDKLKFSQLTGYMKGFIDLVFEAGGQYYIVDYKSNELGSEATDYTQAAIQQAIAEHHYYLQYLIYCLALHRYLRSRLPNYAWDTHVGGVLYLFLRGMQPASPTSGVFLHKPPLALVEALDRLMWD